MGDFELSKYYEDVLVKYTGSEKIVRIPDGITHIDTSAFSDNKEIEKVILPAGFRHISCSAFYGCINLVEVFVPDSIKYIGYRAFQHCEKLEKINIPTGTKVERYAFDGCKKLHEAEVRERRCALKNDVHVKSWLEAHQMSRLQRIYSICTSGQDQERENQLHASLLSSADENMEYAALYVLIAAVLAQEHDPDVGDFFPLDVACKLFAKHDLEERCRELAEELDLEDMADIDDLMNIIQDYMFGL